jgi:Protein of unknown function, DUF488
VNAPEMYTSYWANRALIRLPVVPVQISRGTPKWTPPYRYRVARLLAPSRETFEIRSDEDFEAAYLRELEEAGVERIGALLRKFSDEAGGRPLVLLCFERDPGQCHRATFGGWWESRTGEKVEELRPGHVGRGAEQLDLFSDEGSEEL